MKHEFKFILTILFVLVNSALGNYRDTGFKTVKQPDGSEFVGRTYGDEFEHKSITNAGYVYVKNSSTGWSYYAILNSKGDYSASNSRVGIDPPPVQPNLERSKECKERILNRREMFNSSAPLTANAQGGGESGPSIGILLVEFNGKTHWTNATYRPNGYTQADFLNLMFSEGSYYSSPEGRPVYGSVRDYYAAMSLNSVIIDGALANEEDPLHPGVPKWLTLPDSEYYYECEIGSYDPFHFETTWPGVAIVYAESHIPGFSRYNYDKIAIIYAQDPGENNLQSATAGMYGRYYWTSEHYSEWFNTIGVHCHELGHALYGFPDQYEAQGATEKPQPGYEDYHRHGLMARGDANGPDLDGSAPAPIEPVFRVMQLWVSPRTLGPSEALPNHSFGDVTGNPIFYRILVSRQYGEDFYLPQYYIIENRQRKSFYEQFTPSDEGLLLWEKFAFNDPNGNANKIDLIEADDNWNNEDNYFPGTTNTRIFIGDGSGGFVISGKSGSAGDYSYDIELRGDGYVWSGSITDNTMLSGTITANSLTFANKVYALASTTAKMNANSTLSFSNGGYLVTNGVPAYHVSFISNGSTWGGMLFSGSQASSSHIIYTNVRDVLTYGGAAITVIGTTNFSLSYSNLTNNINYSTSGTSFINAGQPSVHHNLITSNGSYGLRYQNTSGNLWANDIENNIYGGVSLYYYASPLFGNNGFPAYYGNNIINGGIEGLNTSWYCNPYVGSQQTSYYGYNTITNTTSTRVNASSYCTVLAENNWWGSGSPNPAWFYKDATSSIDYIPYLTRPPGEERQQLFTGGSKDSASFGEKLLAAKISIVQKDYQTAKDLLMDVVLHDSISREVFGAIIDLVDIYRTSPSEDVRTFIEERVPAAVKSSLLYRSALLQLYSISGETERRDMLFEAILASTPFSEDVVPVFLDHYYQKFCEKSVSNEDRKRLAEMGERFPGNGPIKEALWITATYLNDIPSVSLGKSSQRITTVEDQGWVVRQAGSASFLWLFFSDSLNGLALGDSVYATSDGGKLWEKRKNSYAQGSSMAFLSPTTWIAGQRGSAILKTTDGGVTWNMKQSSLGVGRIPYDITSIYFQNQNIGWAVAARYLEKTYNGGETWTIVDSSLHGTTNVITFASANRGYIFQGNGDVAITVDGGATWQSKNISPVGSSSFFSAAFSDSLHGVAVVLNQRLIRTTDGGETWEIQSVPAVPTSVCFIGKDTGWVVGEAGLILRTTNQGASWDQQESHTSNGLRAVYFTSAQKGCAVGYNGTILTTTTGGVVTSVFGQESAPKAFALSQNFPNPFNPKTTIQFTIAESRFVTLKVYDVLSREITTLVNEKKEPGVYRVEFDDSPLSSGVYFYVLHSGNFYEVKKMALVK